MDLNKILEELAKYKNPDRSDVLAKHIQKRLNASLSTYYKELDKSLSYLQARNEVKLLKKINNYQEEGIKDEFN